MDERTPPSDDPMPRLGPALKKLHLLNDEELLPEPFRIIRGESESSVTYFIIVETPNDPSLRLYAIKHVSSPAKRARLWEEIERFRQQKCHAALLPAEGNDRDDEFIVYNDGRWIGGALRKTALLKDGASVPKPIKVMTGLAGFSRVYLMTVGNGQAFLAKFDRPDRLEAEWKSIQKLQSRLDQPMEIVEPVRGNTEADGIMLYPAFQGRTISGRVLQLDEFLRLQLLTNSAHVSSVLKLLRRFLTKLYLGGQHVYSGVSWESVNQDLVANRREIETVLIANKLVASPKAEDLKLSVASVPGPFPNPLRHVEKLLKDSIPRLFAARTHGDLQSTNMLISLGDFSRPEELAVIDIEKFSPAGSVVEDIVRIEADFWRSVFTAVAADLFAGRSKKARLAATLEAFAVAIDRLDGRGEVKSADAEVQRLADAAGQFICDFRNLSWSLLRRTGAEHDWNPDYFYGLLFYYLKALSRPLVSGDPVRLRVVALGASFAVKTLHDMENGLYPVQRCFPTGWERATPTPSSRGAAGEPPAVVFGTSQEDAVGFEKAYLEVMDQCLDESGRFLIATSYPPFFSRSEKLQTLRHRRKQERGDATEEVLKLVLQRYDRWARIMEGAGARVLIEAGAHQAYFCSSRLDFEAGERAEQLQHYVDLIERSPHLEIGLSQRTFSETFFAGPKQSVLTYNNHPPESAPATRVTQGIYYRSPERAAAYRRKFDELWRESMHNKAKVVAWLKGQLGSAP